VAIIVIHGATATWARSRNRCQQMDKTKDKCPVDHVTDTLTNEPCVDACGRRLLTDGRAFFTYSRSEKRTLASDLFRERQPSAPAEELWVRKPAHMDSAPAHVHFAMPLFI
jgi:hypothetical protein